MTTILYSSTYGTDDPTRATLPFLAAVGAIDAGFKAQILLQGEAAFLMLDHLVDQIHGVGWPPLKEIIEQVSRSAFPGVGQQYPVGNPLADQGLGHRRRALVKRDRYALRTTHLTHPSLT